MLFWTNFFVLQLTKVLAFLQCRSESPSLQLRHKRFVTPDLDLPPTIFDELIHALNNWGIMCLIQNLYGLWH